MIESRTVNQLRNFLPYYLYFIVTLPFLLFIAPARYAGRDAIRECAKRMGIARFQRKPSLRLPKLDAPEILAEGLSCNLLAPNFELGSVTTYEMLIIDTLVRRSDPKRLFEIGTFNGRTTLNLAGNSSPEAEIFTLDMTDDLGRTRYDGSSFASKISRVICDSRQIDVARYGGMDFIFIDGGHDANIVQNDSLKAIEMLAPGGTIVWHDYGVHDGVTNILHELAEIDPRFRALRRIPETSLAILAPNSR